MLPVILFGLLLALVTFLACTTSLTTRRVRPGSKYRVAGKTKDVPANVEIRGLALQVDEDILTRSAQLLEAFHDLCTEHEYVYWISGTTHLNQVQFSGICPWDARSEVSVPDDAQPVPQSSRLAFHNGGSYVTFRDESYPRLHIVRTPTRVPVGLVDFEWFKVWAPKRQPQHKGARTAYGWATDEKITAFNQR